MKVRLTGEIAFVQDIEASNIDEAKDIFYKMLLASKVEEWIIIYDDSLIEQRTKELNQKMDMKYKTL